MKISHTAKQLKKLLCGLALFGFISGTAYAAPIVGELEYNGQFYPESGTDGTGGTATLGAATYLDFISPSGNSTGTGDLSVLTGTGMLNLYGFAINPFINPTLVWEQVGAGDLSFTLTSLSIVTQTNNLLVLEGTGIFSGTGYDDTLGFWSLTSQDAGSPSSPLTFSASTAVPEPGVLSLLGITLLGLGLTRRNKIRPIAG